jgi:lipopolysaccharide biosynthesis protein
MGRLMISRSAISLSMPDLTIESGELPLENGSRAAIIASFGATRVVSRSVATLVAELKSAGYPVILVRASDQNEPLLWPEGSISPDVVVRKPNVGYDFGSLSVGLAIAPEVLDREYVLLLNDSLLGPFAPLTELIGDFEATTADVWGACQTMQVIPHIQSFFIGFRGGVLSDPSLRSFWKSVRHQTDKSRIIADYEIGLSRLLYSESFSTSSAVDSARVVHPADNPTIAGWKRLIDLGIPFVKRELFLNPGLVVDGHLIRDYIVDTFGTDPEEWL